MAKSNNNETVIVPKIVSSVPKARNNDDTSEQDTFMFSKENYMYMGIGLLVIAIGFICMAGGKSPDPHMFNADEIYSFRRITLAPILIVAGFLFEIYAIMWTPKENN